MQACESTEIKDAFIVRMQAPGIVHQGHRIFQSLYPLQSKGHRFRIRT